MDNTQEKEPKAPEAAPNQNAPQAQQQAPNQNPLSLEQAIAEEQDRRTLAKHIVDLNEKISSMQAKMDAILSQAAKGNPLTETHNTSAQEAQATINEDQQDPRERLNEMIKRNVKFIED